MTSKCGTVMTRRIGPRLRAVQYGGAALACALLGAFVLAGSVPAPTFGSLLARDNLIGWEVKIGSPEERARMLKKLGFKRYAHRGGSEDTSSAYVDREIEALQINGIELTAWYFFSDDPAKDPQVRTALESFKRHGIRPQVWISQSFSYLSKSAEELQRLGVVLPKHAEDIRKYSQAEQQRLFEAVHRLREDAENFPKNPQEQEERLKRETDRIYSLAKLVEPYGVNVKLYNHEGWFAVMENELAIIDRLKEKQVTNVGIVYNFFHARDALHDDTKDFPRVWERIQPHVAAVNISGVRGQLGECLSPSEGDHEVEMMRTIEQSGWKGPVGVLAACFDRDPESGLRNILLGTDWVAAELKQPGSGGPRPLF